MSGQAAHLPAGHAVEQVIEYNKNHVDVAARRLQQVLQADGGPAVTLYGDHLFAGVGQPQGNPQGQRRCPAVQAMDGVGGQDGIHQPGTADIADDDDVQRAEAGLFQGLCQVLNGDAMPATGAERHVFGDQDGLSHTANSFMISEGAIMLPILLTLRICALRACP